MIEKLPAPRSAAAEAYEWGNDPVTMRDIRLKLNEVIEAVNRMERVQPGVIIGTPQTHNGPHFVTGLSIVENAPKSPGFRPLHIEDGQVVTPQDGFISGGWGPPYGPSVPEAEPQEQVQSLEDALIGFEEAVIRRLEYARGGNPRMYEEAHIWQEECRKAVRAAAHREYAQPDNKVCEHRLQCHVVTFDGTCETGRYTECFDCKKRLLAAQPDKQ